MFSRCAPLLLFSVACSVASRPGPDANALHTGESPHPDGPLVVESVACARCHANSESADAMRDAQGRGVAPYDLWRSTMMANAARDPLWRAQVAAEVAATPSRAEEIEATCFACHAPMAARAGAAAGDVPGLDGGAGTLMDVLHSDGRLGKVARDGVSCTICHGMLPDKLGTEASYSGGYELDPARRIFGPHADPFPPPMQVFVGFTPTYSEHVTESSLCGSCHTLFTDTIEPNGRRTGERFPEQTPYLEWRNSDFNDEQAPGPLAASCQDCHMPTTDVDGAPLATGIAHNPGGRDFPWIEDRTPYGRHVLVGGNTLVLSLLRDNAEELAVEAPRAAFDATIAATRQQLEQRTASVAIEDLRRDGDELTFRARVVNRTGHKLPTGHPTRRVWLRTIVRDANGAVVFASGGTDAAGRVVGSDGEPLPSELVGGPIEPHRDVVTNGNEVAQFRGIMADTHGDPTFTLIRAATWHVDDRILPAGWRADHPDAKTTRPYGIGDDPDFTGGSDGVGYRVRVPADATGPFEVEVALLHQSLAARWTAELLTVDAPEVHALARMLARADREPDVLAVTTERLE